MQTQQIYLHPSVGLRTVQRDEIPQDLAGLPRAWLVLPRAVRRQREQEFFRVVLAVMASDPQATFDARLSAEQAQRVSRIAGVTRKGRYRVLGEFSEAVAEYLAVVQPWHIRIETDDAELVAGSPWVPCTLETTNARLTDELERSVPRVWPERGQATERELVRARAVVWGSRLLRYVTLGVALALGIWIARAGGIGNYVLGLATTLTAIIALMFASIPVQGWLERRY